MATTIKEDEAIPATYPATPSGLSTEAAAITPAIIWQRVEVYTAHRFSSRAIVWVAEGDGYWLPPLSPATIATFELWSNDAWEVVDAPPGSPLGGYTLRGCGPWRFTGTVGAGRTPEIVDEAYRRLAEYFADVREMAATRGTAGVSRNDFTIGQLSESVTRSQAWTAKAMEASGAGDLLRSFRRP